MPAAPRQERLKELERDLASLLENERALQAVPDSADLCDRILRQAMEATGADAGSLFLRQSSGHLVCVAAGGEKAAAVRHYALVPGRGIVGTVAESGKPILTDARADPRHDRSIAARIDYPAGSILAVPILDESRVAGVLELLTRAGGGKGFEKRHLKLITLMAGQAARAIQSTREAERRFKESRLEALSLVIHGLAHDVRNPLTFINGYAELLSDGGSDPEGRTRAREAIFQSVDDINAMLRELVEFADGRETVHREPADLSGMARAVVELFAKKAGGGKIRLRVRTRGDARGSYDPAKLRRLLENLLKNALEATPAGGRVFVGVLGRAGEVLLWVRDSGGGVPPEVMSRLFEPFVTAGKKSGTGLGLSLCRRFAQAHGGEIDCRTSRRGTRFLVRIPRG